MKKKLQIKSCDTCRHKNSNEFNPELPCHYCMFISEKNYEKWESSIFIVSPDGSNIPTKTKIYDESKNCTNCQNAGIHPEDIFDINYPCYECECEVQGDKLIPTKWESQQIRIGDN